MEVAMRRLCFRDVSILGLQIHHLKIHCVLSHHRFRNKGGSDLPFNNEFPVDVFEERMRLDGSWICQTGAWLSVEELFKEISGIIA